jgi:anaerobic dimethyl sulfoxide reductase subunit B
MKHSLVLDVKRCTGCQACVVACMDHNDLFVKKKQDVWRHIIQVERGVFPEANINYISLTCMHCEDSPCILGCPTGALIKDDNIGAVLVRHELCIGCHSCSLACPFGIPRFNHEGKMFKCNLCKERIENSLEPACVHTCPTKALTYGKINELSQKKFENVFKKIAFQSL